MAASANAPFCVLVGAALRDRLRDCLLFYFAEVEGGPIALHLYHSYAACFSII